MAARRTGLAQWFADQQGALAALDALDEPDGRVPDDADERLACVAALRTAVAAAEAAPSPPDDRVAAHLGETLTLYRHAADRLEKATVAEDSAALAAARRARRQASTSLRAVRGVAAGALTSAPAGARSGAVTWAT